MIMAFRVRNKDTIDIVNYLLHAFYNDDIFLMFILQPDVYQQT